MTSLTQISDTFQRGIDTCGDRPGSDGGTGDGVDPAAVLIHSQRAGKAGELSPEGFARGGFAAATEPSPAVSLWETMEMPLTVPSGWMPTIMEMVPPKPEGAVSTT